MASVGQSVRELAHADSEAARPRVCIRPFKCQQYEGRRLRLTVGIEVAVRDNC
jgi:hypothetical protein